MMLGATEETKEMSQVETSAESLLEARRLSVLIIEDEASIRTIMDRVFRQLDSNVEIIWAKSAEEGLKLIQRRDLDLIISDYFLTGRLTGLNVWNFCKGHVPQVPIFMMSNLSIPSFIELTKDLPEKPAFLPKPFTVGDCRNFVQAHLYGMHL